MSELRTNHSNRTIFQKFVFQEIEDKEITARLERMQPLLRRGKVFDDHYGGTTLSHFGD